MSTPVIAYISPVLPWDPLPGESRRLRILMAIMLLLAFLIWIIVPRVEIPRLERAQAEAVPERLARMVIQQKVVPPPPKPVEESKPEEAAIPTTKEAPKAATPVEVETAPKAVVSDLQKSAAKARAGKAIQDAGIADALAGLRDMDVGSAAVAGTGGPGPGGSGGLITSTEAAGTSRNLLTSRAGSGSGAMSSAGYGGGGQVSSGFGGGVAGGKGSKGMLGGGGGKLQAVESSIKGAETAARPVNKDGKSRRTAEDIRKVFDQYGARLNNAHQRALRDNPNLQGTLTLKLTIAPDGSVSNCTIVSSQLDNPELEAKIVAIVKGFNFGADNVEVFNGQHTLNFFSG